MCGFTLAEVLITLAVIGVVAAMTIPTLVSSYKKTVVETRLQKFYSVMNQAILLSKLDNGETKDWDFADGTGAAGLHVWYDNYFAPYLKTTEVREGSKYSSDSSAALLVFFPDGSMDEISYGGRDHSFIISAGDYFKRNLQSGRNSFGFAFYPDKQWSAYASAQQYNNGLTPYAPAYPWNGKDRNYLMNNNPQIYGSLLIQLNGWKIPDDYPIKL